MNIEHHNITIQGLPVLIVRKDIKNLHLGVYPPHGHVRVAAPLAVSNDAVRRAVIHKWGWVKRMRTRFKNQPRQSKREMVTGESHYFLGRRYRLHVIHDDNPRKIIIRKNSTLELNIRSGSTILEREEVLFDWYRQRLKTLIPSYLKKWRDRLGVEVSEWGIKKMKTRWGSCNAKAQRFWLNLELAKHPAHCLEYVVLHELVHLIERHHNNNFVAIMDKNMPHWRTYRKELNSTPLSHEFWSCTGDIQRISKNH